MERSIQHFINNSIGIFGEVIGKFFKEPTKIAEFVCGITANVRDSTQTSRVNKRKTVTQNFG